MKPEQNDLIVCQKIRDFVRYYSPLTEKFRRTCNFSYGELSRITMRKMISLSRRARNMKSGPAKLAMIHELDEMQDDLQTDLELAVEFNCISAKSFAYASGLIAEIGRLIGGWEKSVQTAIKKIGS